MNRFFSPSLENTDRRLGDNGTNGVCQALKKNTVITSLDLGREHHSFKCNGCIVLMRLELDNMIGDTGIQSLSDALKINTKLKSLFISGENDTQKDFQHVLVSSHSMFMITSKTTRKPC